MSVAYYNYRLARRAEKQRRKIHRRVIRDSTNPFELPDTEFFRLYRANKAMALYLVEELNVDLAPRNPLGLPTHIKVLSSLQLLGTGHYQRGVGQDHVVAIAQSTVSKYLGQFTSSLVRRLMGRWISFPSDRRSRETVAQIFTDKFGVGNVLGAIDCTQVQIFPPPQAHGAAYRNRHGITSINTQLVVTSINTQLVVDANCRILHINARYPGSVHDSFIFNNSNIRDEMKRITENRLGEYFLLGDSGYPLEPWIMTPVLNAEPNSPGDRFTKWHCKARNTVERTNGYLKGSFRCMGGDRSLRYLPSKASEIIYACAVLYNIKLHYRVPIVVDDDTETDESVSGSRQPLVTDQTASLRRLGEQRRQDIITRYFN